jgi:cytochrome c556
MKNKLALILACLVFIPISASAENVDGAIKYRKAVMTAIKGNADALVQILTDGVEGKEDAIKDITASMALAAKYSTTSGAFEMNTNGKESKEKTTSTAKVWEEWEDFTDALKRMETAANLVAEKGADGSLTIGDMKSNLFKECGYCHRKAGYRTKN